MESHMIHITQRAHMSLTGLEKVISMEPELVEVETTADHLAIKGQNLHAEKLDMEKGEDVYKRQGLYISSVCTS